MSEPWQMREDLMRQARTIIAGREEFEKRHFKSDKPLRKIEVDPRDLVLMLEEAEECDPLLTRMGDLLDRVANALKGPPAPLTSHDWSDLPKVAEELAHRMRSLEK